MVFTNCAVLVLFLKSKQERNKFRACYLIIVNSNQLGLSSLVLGRPVKAF